jgi:hypothetical protein
MSLEDQGDGIRVITPVVFFPPGHMQSQPLNAVTKVEGNEESAEKPAAPKDSSAPASVSSSSAPVAPAQTPTESPSPSSPVPPAPPAPTATADKANGQPKANGSSTPAG